MSGASQAPGDASNWQSYTPFSFQLQDSSLGRTTASSLDGQHFNTFMGASNTPHMPKHPREPSSFSLQPLSPPAHSQIQGFPSSPYDDFRIQSPNPHIYPVSMHGTRTSPRRSHDYWHDWHAREMNELEHPPPHIAQPNESVPAGLKENPKTLPEASKGGTRKRKLGSTEADGQGNTKRKGRKKTVGEGEKATSGKGKGSKTMPVKPKAKGRGSKSGKNAREPGVSDKEIAQLGESEAEQAGVQKMRETWKDDERDILVSYVVDPQCWADFKVNQARIWMHVASTLLPGKTVEQVRRQWYCLWDCSKACRRRAEHTGGGDGDEINALDSDSGSNEEDDRTGDAAAKGRTRASTKKGKGAAGGETRGQFSHKQMDAFEQTWWYQMIDEVAHDNSDVVRAHKFNSHRSDSDSSETETKTKPSKDPNVALIEDTIWGIDERHRADQQVQVRQLALAEARDKREAEAETRRLQTAEEDRKLRLWKQYEEWSSSPNPLLQKRAEKLGRQLAEEEGISMD